MCVAPPTPHEGWAGRFSTGPERGCRHGKLGNERITRIVNGSTRSTWNVKRLACADNGLPATYCGSPKAHAGSFGAVVSVFGA